MTNIFARLTLCACAAAISLLCSPGRAAPPNQPNQGSGAGYQRLQDLQTRAEAALQAGDAADAARLATQLLRENTDRSSWNYGNVVYDGNQLLGLAALRQGNVVAANRFLLAAGRTPGSPQLDSFGPEMPLAQALYAQGERQTVVTFLDEVAKFWATPPPNEPEKFLSLYAHNAATIQHWKDQIAAGQKPSLNRFDFFDAGAGSPQSSEPAPKLLDVGAQAPDFTVSDRTGRPLRLSDYRGRVVVLDFWATWCGPCQASLPHTNAVARQFRGRNVVVLAVNVSDSQQAFDGWLPRHPEYDAITFAIDPTDTRKSPGRDVAARLYGVSGIPTQYVIGPDGRVVRSFVGFSGPTGDLASAINEAGAG